MDAGLNIQFLTDEPVSEKLIARLKAFRPGLDIYFERLTAENVKELKKNNVEINCWTVEDKTAAEKLISYGADYITTNILK